jgi:hypothetical protein
MGMCLGSIIHHHEYFCTACNIWLNIFLRFTGCSGRRRVLATGFCVPWKSTVLWRSRLQTSILESGTETFLRPNAPDKQKGFPSLVKIRRSRLHFQKLWGCLVDVCMSAHWLTISSSLTKIVRFFMQKSYQTDSLFKRVPPIFGECCLTPPPAPNPPPKIWRHPPDSQMSVTMVEVALTILNLKLSGVGSFSQSRSRNNEVQLDNGWLEDMETASYSGLVDSLLGIIPKCYIFCTPTSSNTRNMTGMACQAELAVQGLFSCTYRTKPSSSWWLSNRQTASIVCRL